MIQFHYISTPNGEAVRLLLEEIKEQHNIEYEIFAATRVSRIAENSTPFIVDSAAGGSPVAIFGAGYSLLYLADRYAPELLGDGPLARAHVFEWVSWQTTFQRFHPSEGQDPSGAVELLGALDNHLREQNQDYIAGATYTVADILCYAWADDWLRSHSDVTGLRAFHGWFEKIRRRPAAQTDKQIDSLIRHTQPFPTRTIEILRRSYMLAGDTTQKYPPR